MNAEALVAPLIQLRERHGVGLATGDVHEAAGVGAA
jgi:hypothetical protein